MSIGFDGICSMLIQDWVIQKQTAPCWDIGAIGLGEIISTQRHWTLHLSSGLGEVRLVWSASTQGATLGLIVLCGPWKTSSAEFWRLRAVVAYDPFGIGDQMGVKPSVSIPCRVPPSKRQTENHSCARGGLDNGSRARSSYPCYTSILPSNGPRRFHS